MIQPISALMSNSYTYKQPNFKGFYEVGRGGTYQTELQREVAEKVLKSLSEKRDLLLPKVDTALKVAAEKYSHILPDGTPITFDFAPVEIIPEMTTSANGYELIDSNNFKTPDGGLIHLLPDGTPVSIENVFGETLPGGEPVTIDAVQQFIEKVSNILDIATDAGVVG